MFHARSRGLCRRTPCRMVRKAVMLRRTMLVSRDSAVVPSRAQVRRCRRLQAGLVKSEYVRSSGNEGERIDDMGVVEAAIASRHISRVFPRNNSTHSFTHHHLPRYRPVPAGPSTAITTCHNRTPPHLASPMVIPSLPPLPFFPPLLPFTRPLSSPSPPPSLSAYVHSPFR